MKQHLKCKKMLIVRNVNKKVLSCKNAERQVEGEGCPVLAELRLFQGVDLEELSCDVFPKDDPHRLLRLGAGWLSCLGV